MPQATLEPPVSLSPELPPGEAPNPGVNTAIRTGEPPYLNVYRGVAMSAIGILAWKSVKPETQKKLLGGNADRFFKQT